jgi:uncharacterized protein (DUF1330 family)
MKKLYTIERIAKLKELTYQIFDIFDIQLSKDFFEKISNHKNIYIAKKYEEKMSDNSVFIFNEIKEDINFNFKLDRMRVSISCLVRLRYKNNYVFLIENGIIKPFGGAYIIRGQKLPLIYEKENEESDDLRIYIESKEIKSLRKWWFSLNDPENNPLRELYEEFVDENHIVYPEIFNKEFGKYK